MNNKRKGFTILELVIVLIINAILGTAIMFRMSLFTEIKNHNDITASYVIEKESVSEKNS